MDERGTTPLTVTIRTREKILFQGKVTALTSVNERGLFDILSEHENFISIIKEKIILHGSEKTFLFTTGILRVEDNVVSVSIGVTASKEAMKNDVR
jgi:F0F1-type ATP synthase epsilon subunit